VSSGREGVLGLRVRDAKGAGGDKRPGARSAERAASRTDIEKAQLMRFLRWLSVVAFAFALLEGAAFFAFRDVGTGVTSVVLSVFGCITLVARAQVGRGKRRPAVVLTCAAFLGAILITAPAQPSLTPTFTIGVLMAVAVALSYATKRFLGLLAVVAWIVILAVAVLGELMPRYSTLPAWYDSFFRVASLLSAAAVVLLLLWQFRERLVGTLEQARAAEERLRWEATHDVLTSLPNRALLTERLARAIGRAKKDPGYSFAVLFLDLDRFKNVNDSLGHGVGDLLLREIARRLRASVHATDTVTRLGGDEFVVLLEDVADPENAAEVARRLQDELRAPVKIYGHELFTTASIGVVSGESGYDEPEEILRDADTAMYHAKENGKARHAVFGPAMRTRAISRLRLDTDLRRAVEQGEFAVYYQPVVWLASGRVSGFEALLRWQHPERGLVPPGDFVPLAEETGLIFPIGHFVLREACRKAALWRSRFPDHRPLTMSVNISAAQLARPDLPDLVAGALEEAGLDGRDLALEITESTIIRDEKAAAAAFPRLKSLGVRMYVDDFGTGHSSLASLHRYPVDALKIDRSFVGGMGVEGQRAEIVHAIATLAHQLGMETVAEGVGNLEQLERLREMGCDRAQGYLFSRPVTSEAAEAILAAGPSW
jgi:diguanylate cyclase (GGDEF)-like protein